MNIILAAAAVAVVYGLLAVAIYRVNRRCWRRMVGTVTTGINEGTLAGGRRNKVTGMYELVLCAKHPDDLAAMRQLADSAERLGLPCAEMKEGLLTGGYVAMRVAANPLKDVI